MTHAKNLDFWLLSIYGAAPSALIRVVCTKTDLVSEDERERRYQAVKEIFVGKAYESQIHNVTCVSSKTNEGVDNVRTKLMDCSHILRYGQKVPLGWFKFQATLKEMIRTENCR